MHAMVSLRLPRASYIRIVVASGMLQVAVAIVPSVTVSKLQQIAQQKIIVNIMVHKGIAVNQRQTVKERLLPSVVLLKKVDVFGNQIHTPVHLLMKKNVWDWTK
jgi:hypothetical protein